MTDEAWVEVLAGRPDCLPENARERVWAASDFVRQQALRHPAMLLGLCEEGLLDRPRESGEVARELQRLLRECQDETRLEAVLRRFRNREMSRIIWRDLTDQATLQETLEELSELADCCIRQALGLLYRWAVAKDGVPRDAEGTEQQLVVLSMGKLGARELNLSSDIDLIFCFPSHGRTDGRRGVENEAFFTRLGRRLVNVLSRQTVDGFVFRVDMRLRPFGEAGPLVVSFDAMEHYLHAQAREWERYALVKARPVCGEPGDRETLQSMINSFVYRRYIDFGAIEAIRELKRMIVRDLARKGMKDNIKLGFGGIREVEFIGQAFQLVRGGRDVDLQIRPVQQVLERLGNKGLMPAFAVQQLQQAYVFLRRAENRLQAWKDQQTQALPTDHEGRERLAVSMGFAGWDEFARELDRHRRQVQSQFEQVFEAPQAEHSSDGSVLAALWQVPEHPQNHLELLRAAGFTQAEQVLAEIERFRESPVLRTLSSSARGKLDRLMPLALEALALQEHADRAVPRLLKLLESIVRRTAYLDLLVENPLALSQLVRLLGESVWVGSVLQRQPILLDELLDPRRLYSPVRSEELRRELDNLLRSVDQGDEEQEMQRLRQFAQGNRLRVAAADIAGAIPLMVVSDYLTEIAETSLQQVLRSSWRDISRRHGRPALPQGFESGFAVIGYGKLGGLELGYGSDLDLVFLHGSDSANGMTDGRRQVPNEVFYARLGQRVIHMLTTRMPSGMLYEIDMRLRPNGNSGMLVSSLKAFNHYQREQAWTWEHQALVRARAVAGDPMVIERFNALRREILCRQREPDALRSEVRQMRARMAAHLDQSDERDFDIKQGPGGLVDIEFMVQFAVLHWAHEYPGLVDWTDNARLLERLVEYGLLPGRDAERLFDVYRVFRAVTHRCALQEDKASVRQDQWLAERRLVRDAWERLIG